MPFALVALFFFSLSACTPEEDDDEPEEPVVMEPEPMAAGSAKAEDLYFFHAWLANCINGDFASGQMAEAELRTKATDRIKGAIADSKLIPVFGETELVWGPQLAVEAETAGSMDYTSGNLMYCLRALTATGEYSYYIGIAGTNSISTFDWFVEDLEVAQQEDWISGKGKISKGAMTGFDIINGLKDPTSGQTLEAYLLAEMEDNTRLDVHVAGHSLGGALAQVYSSHLANRVANENTFLNAWVYASPTPGDATFATSLTSDLGNNYSAYNNSMDAVAKAWTKSSLETVCSLYNGETICGSTITPSIAVNGIAKYLVGISEAGGYTVPGTPNTFTETLPTRTGAQCTDLDFALFGLWQDDLPGSTYDYLNQITGSCESGNFISEAEFYRYFYFMIEMGEQHTTAYQNHFIPAEVRTEVDSYVPAAPLLDMFQAVEVMEDFLQKASAYLQANGITDCTCN